MRNSVIVIPALNPKDELFDYVSCLIQEGFSKIILIDDGSKEREKVVFKRLETLEQCDILVHTVNMGKGRALKDAFNYYCQKYEDEYLGVITVDSDGQHTVADIVNLDCSIQKNCKALILGVRNFDAENVPFKSRMGNKITRYVMSALLGNSASVTDTQTGLRGIPNKLLRSYLTLYGERFEYETAMLIEAIQSKTKIEEIPIETIYIDNNSETHFRPIADSWTIYKLLLGAFFKYTASSIASFFVDYGVYLAWITILQQMPLATRVMIASAVARIISSVFNFTVNKSLVFKSRANIKVAIVRYYALCLIQLFCSAICVTALCTVTGVSETILKPVVDIMLFLVSYRIQRAWVFATQEVKNK